MSYKYRCLVLSYSLALLFAGILLTSCMAAPTPELIIRTEIIEKTVVEAPTDGASEAFPPIATPSLAPTPETTPLPAVPEERLMVLEWPPKIRVGDSDLIILTLELDEEGNLSATAQFEDHQVRSSQVQIPNLYDTHNVVAQARLDMAGVEFSPQGEISEPMRPGVPVKFTWSVLPRQVGSYRGTLWLHLQFIPLDGGESSRQALSAQVIDIEAVNLFGVGGVPARFIGAVGTVVGALLSMDKIGGWIWRAIKTVLPKTKSKNDAE